MLRGLVSRVTEQTISDDIRDQFAALDPEGTGGASLAAIRELLLGNRFSLSGEEVERLLAELDQSKTDCIKFDDFVAIMISWQSVRALLSP